jgi:hypothetical protein
LYAKVFSSLYQGTLRGNSHGILVFTNLLAHCDKEGHVDVHPRAIAEEVGLTIEQVRATLLELEGPDEESRTPDEGGRRIIRLDEHRAWGWRVVNYVKYREIKNEEDRRESNRLAQARWREKNKAKSADVSDSKQESADSKRESAESAQVDVDVALDVKVVDQELPATPGEKPPAEEPPPSDPIWGNGLDFLLRKGLAKGSARSLIGLMRKELQDDFIVAELLIEAERQDICAPQAWLLQAAKGRKSGKPGTNKHPANENLKGKTYAGTDDANLPADLR